MSSPTPELKLDLEKPFTLFVRAGAGAGKTTLLIKTFFDFSMQFKQKNGRWPKIVLTTFTRKATQEIKERLLVKALELNNPEMTEWLSKKSYVHISTIHGVLSLLLKKYFEKADLSSQFKIVDDLKIYKKQHRLLKKTFRQNVHLTELLDHYKFKDLIFHLNRALQFKSEYGDLKGLTLKQAVEYREDVLQKFKKTLQEIKSSSDQMTEAWTNYIQTLDQAFSILQLKGFDQFLIQLENLGKKPPFLKKKPAFSEELHEQLTEMLDGQKGQIWKLESDAEIEELVRINNLFLELLIDFEKEYLQLRKQNSEISVSELETISLNILKNNPEVRKNFSDHFDFYMIDEFQDTSPLQVEIMEYLVQDKPHFIVGDPQQSIYLFRGARSEVFEQKQKDVLKNGFEVQILDTNYRTKPPVMSYLNDLLSKVPTPFSPMKTHPEPEKLGESKVNHHVHYLKGSSEINMALYKIQSLLDQGVSAKDICVLGRKNKVLQELAYVALKLNYPVQLNVATGFENKREVIDLTSFLKFLMNPYDDENLVRLLRSPWFLISDQEILNLRQSSQDSCWSQVKKSNHEVLLALQSYLKEYQSSGVEQALITFLQKTLFFNSSYFLDPTGQREANIWKFIFNLKDEMKNPAFSLSDFIANQFSQFQNDLSSNKGEAVPSQKVDRVQLMTVHNSKGLQFRHVILMGLADQPQTTKILNSAYDSESHVFGLDIYDQEKSQLKNSFWTRRFRLDLNQREIDESWRVFYVALTRTIESITMIAEDKKRASSSNWSSGLNWPDEGISDFNQCTVFSEVYTGEPEKCHRQDEFSLIQKRAPLNLSVTKKDSVSVSKAAFDLDNKTSSEAFNLETKLIPQIQKAIKGTELHQYFESLKYNHVKLAHLNPEEQKALTYLQDDSKLEIPLQKILNQGFVEYGFGLKVGDQMIRGQIDAWGIVDGTAYVIDYKTGKTNYSETAFAQLGSYADCLRAMKKINQEKIVLAVVYPFDQKILTREMV